MTETQLRAKYVAAAVAWLGYKESDNSHMTIVNIYNNHSPLAQGYVVQSTDAWCATYVSATAIVTDLTAIIPTECSCPRQIALFQALGRWMEADGYSPQAGDIMYFAWSDSGSGDCTATANHVGIVVKVDGTTITVIEGNKDNAVGYRTMAVNGKYIRGYGIPDFASLANDYTEVTAALNSLTAKGIINSPDYWLDAVKAGTVTYLDSLVIQADGILKSAGTRTATYQDGIAGLVAKGIINTPTHWQTVATTLDYLPDLLCALGGAT